MWAFSTETLIQISVSAAQAAAPAFRLDTQGAQPIAPSEDTPMHNVFYLIGLIVVVMAVINLAF